MTYLQIIHIKSRKYRTVESTSAWKVFFFWSDVMAEWLGRWTLTRAATGEILRLCVRAQTWENY